MNRYCHLSLLWSKAIAVERFYKKGLRSKGIAVSTSKVLRYGTHLQGRQEGVCCGAETWQILAPRGLGARILDFRPCGTREFESQPPWASRIFCEWDVGKSSRLRSSGHCRPVLVALQTTECRGQTTVVQCSSLVTVILQ